jgi:hypothetical protein
MQDFAYVRSASTLSKWPSSSLVAAEKRRTTQAVKAQ